MTSRKLAITQLILFAVNLVVTIVLPLLIFKGASGGNLKAIIASSGTMLLINIFIGIALAIIGIIQIVFGSKEKVGLLLAAGICSVVGVIPFVGWFVRIAAFILNIIGVVKTKNL